MTDLTNLISHIFDYTFTHGFVWCGITIWLVMILVAVDSAIGNISNAMKYWGRKG